MGTQARAVGRPSRVDERSEQILSAMADVVARDGLTGTTLANVAAESGLQRTLVLHYFGNRDNLVRAFVTRTVAEYGSAMVAIEHASPSQIVDAVFTPGIYRDERDLAIWLDLVAHAAKDESIRADLQTLWRDVWLPAIDGRLTAFYPSASAEEIAAATYTLTVLFEGHWSLVAQDVPDTAATAAAKALAHRVVDGLGR